MPFIQRSDLCRACLEISQHSLLGPPLTGILIPQSPGQTSLVSRIVGDGVNGPIIDDAQGTLDAPQETVCLPQSLRFRGRQKALTFEGLKHVPRRC
jgi:hypothetical protein